ncbi:hypothetical protein Psi01_27420 [Planobispora siamensis]|uniref:Uncharacterized protein n=1 Tax=Planobispora siamensis TaxID=936338 RepID=A0A8J3SFS6_9ACTN|nr:hypothetical protein Psi01_27420 [Planobispora siamensis]
MDPTLIAGEPGTDPVLITREPGTDSAFVTGEAGTAFRPAVEESGAHLGSAGREPALTAVVVMSRRPGMVVKIDRAVTRHLVPALRTAATAADSVRGPEAREGVESVRPGEAGT